MNRNSKLFRAAVTVEHRVFGVAFLAMLVFFEWLTYAIFSQRFTDFVDVQLQASKTGLQLPSHADVKIRGVIVGQVREVKVGEDGADLTLAIAPDKAHLIPENTTARILPKTLFGEKYVALQVPTSPSSRSIQAGDVIRESKVAIEVEQVLNDFYPLLRTLQPADLNYALTAMANALEGRGESLGENLVILDSYLKRINPQIPALVEDLKKLGTVSDTYRGVVPELANILRNSVTTGNTFVDKEQKIQAFFSDVADFSSTSQDFLQQNGDNIIRLSELGRQQLPLFARYSPEYPCLLKGIVGAIPRQAEVFRGYTLHINLETLPKQPTGYSPAVSPKYGAKNGPHCSGLPNPPYSQAN